MEEKPMSDPGVIRPVDETNMTALTATPRITDDYDMTASSQVDRVIRASTAVAVLAVAGVAAYVSYWHAYAVVRAYGESGVTARLEPATIDGLVYASSMVILYAARHGNPVARLARWLLGLGIAATLTANMAQGWSHGPVGAAVAAWPAISLVGSYELLVWLIRTSGALEREPSADCREGMACHAASRSAPAAATDGGQRNSGDNYRSALGWRPTDQWPGQEPTALADPQGGDRVPETTAENDAAVAAYCLSIKAGNPLSERKLAQMFGRTSRRWARARIADARQSPYDLWRTSFRETSTHETH
jgi:hypothetical protein